LKKDVSKFEFHSKHGDNIPSHLPPFPPQHTYRRTTSKKRSAPQEVIRDTKAERIASNKSIRMSLSQMEARNPLINSNLLNSTEICLNSNSDNIMEDDTVVSDDKLPIPELPTEIKRSLPKEQKILVAFQDSSDI